MKDIFDQVILCSKCSIQTNKKTVIMDGFNIRILECSSCGEITYHPGDLKDYEDFKRLKARDFNVKLRMIGNSFCVSIPKELVDFHKEMENEFNDLVKMSLEKPGRISIVFRGKYL
ncbi:MAG TPA: hypothetical protein VJI68_03070 [Candidatus Nanoarchaeia archaeon]|nr:hypothetical protein [Candidatus Nanoarchaeia archaeon]